MPIDFGKTAPDYGRHRVEFPLGFFNAVTSHRGQHPERKPAPFADCSRRMRFRGKGRVLRLRRRKALPLRSGRW